MEVGVLGASRIVRNGEVVELSARRVRSLLATLALEPGQIVGADRLVDLIWGESAPRGAHGTLHSYISGLRRLLEPELTARSRPQLLITSDAGYRLALQRDAIDATDFADRVRHLHRQVTPLETQLSTGPDRQWPGADEAAGWLERLEAALRRWRGPAYADLDAHPDAVAARAALDELRATAEEDQALIMLALGDAAGVVAATEQVTASNPFRERSWALHALALARSGRQADALAAIRRLRDVLADELGLDPGPQVRELESAILRQDEAILRTIAPVTPALPTSSAPPEPPPTVPQGIVAGLKVTNWPTIGRDREHRLLEHLLDDAAHGLPSMAVVLGEPGVGKSRLTQDLAALATARGILVASGSCTADDGAPPLWPWQSILASVGDREEIDNAPSELTRLRERLVTEDATDHAERSFAVSELLAGIVRNRATRQPVLLVVDDVHWADAPTLRALTQLVATAGRDHRLAIVVTRRPRPEPTGPLADLEVTAVRHGARQVMLQGLSVSETATLVGSVTGQPAVSVDQVRDWCAATGGNPFFLVELARLAGDHDGWSGEVPTTVQTVVRRRLEHLPQDTRELLLVAAALGRAFSLVVLSAVLEIDPWLADERLDPARDAGIVHDRADGLLEFEHALTRDAVLAATRAPQLARTHARIAYTLSQPDAPVSADTKPFELARHWLAAGAVHAAQAWSTAVEAARLASAAYAHEEAVDLYLSALAAQRLDPRAGRDERFTLLLRLAETAAYAGNWQHVMPSTVEAVGIAAIADDPSRVARAAAQMTRHSVWTPQEFGEINADLIDDLRHALGRTDGGDSVERVRLSLALACQLYYVDDRAAEALALVDQGMAMSLRIADPQLTRWATRTASLALWRSAHLDRRSDLVDQELAAARQLGDRDAEALALTTATGIALEAADQSVFRRTLDEASRLTRRRRLGHLRIALGCVELSLAALRGSPDLAALSRELSEMSRQASVVNYDIFLSSLSFLTLLWSPEAPADYLETMVASALGPTGAMVVESAALGLVRLGRLDEAANLLRQARPRPLVDTWGCTWDAASRAEIAYALNDTALAETSAVVLRRYRGRLATAGISIVGGPVDGYLTLAEATLGHRSAAIAAAERALDLAREWELSAYVDWLERHRSRGGW